MRVSELEQIGIIREVHIKKNKNCHTDCRIRMFVDSDDKLTKLRKLVGMEVCVEDDQRIYLRGMITKIDCNISYAGSHACIVITSLSRRLDVEKKYRIFQDTKKTNKDVVAFLSEGGNNIQITDNEFANDIVQEILVQDGKTDFEFIKDLSNNAGLDLYIIDTDSSPCIHICKSINYSKESLCEENTKTCYFEKDDYTERMIISSTNFLEIGQVTNYEGIQYTVISVEIDYIDGVIHFTYILEKKNNFVKSLSFTGMLGEAEIISIGDPENKGRVQVKFLDYEDKMTENRVWIPFLGNITEKKQGSMLIPGIGEVVNVYCKNGRCYSNGCVRNEAFDEKMRNPEERMFYFKDKSITIKDTGIVIEVFGNTITMGDGIINISNEDTLIHTKKDCIYIKSGETKFRMDSGAVQIQSSDKMDIKSNKINIDAIGKMCIKATSLDVG